MSDILTSIPNVSTPCLGGATPPPCLCPPYGPGGAYFPVQTETGWECRLALESGVPGATPIPTLSEWALFVLVGVLALAGAWRLR